MPEILNELRKILPADQVLIGEDIPLRNQQDASRFSPTQPKSLLLPRTTGDLAKALSICNQYRQAVVPQGGMTGLVKAAHPGSDEIAISLERMTGIEEVDPQAGTITVKAGTPLIVLQNAAEEAGFLYGVDLGARGSCTIGGTIATNAGGNQVLRYGMTRRNILGLEAVLATGQVVSSINKMLKNNAGYDWTQLFIGSEGTLGIVTRAVVALQPRPIAVETALVALPSLSAAIQLLRTANRQVSGGLQVFEAMWADFLNVAVEHIGLQKPFAHDFELAVLLETPTNGQQADQDNFISMLSEMKEDSLITDAIIAQSEKDRTKLWTYRESPYEYGKFLPPLIGFDVSVPIGDFKKTIDAIKQDLNRGWPEALIVTFGHLADSNLHMIIALDKLTEGTKHSVEEIVYRHVAHVGGSVSAEHGIGRSKMAYLPLSRSPAELALMKNIKNALDPNNILSPGRIFN